VGGLLLLFLLLLAVAARKEECCATSPALSCPKQRLHLVHIDRISSAVDRQQIGWIQQSPAAFKRSKLSKGTNRNGRPLRCTRQMVLLILTTVS
jgi:hypothetical protein